MSKLLVNLFMLNAKAVVNAYTWTTLPFYAAIQQPWRRLKLSKSFGVKIEKDKHGRTVYSRPCPSKIDHPLLGYYTLNEVVPKLNPNRKAVGLRKVLSEQAQLDPQTGKPIKIDGKEWKKLKLADDYHWFTVKEILERVDAIARGLQQMGVKKGEKVLIYADNSFEWFCSGMALGRLNATTVTLLSILNDEGVLYGANQSEAKYMITSQDLLPRIDRISSQFQTIETLIYFPDQMNPQESKSQTSIRNLKSKFPNVRTLDQVQQVGAQLPVVEFALPDRDDITLIMYTSGTTGNPKGVMLTHRQLGESLQNMLRMQEEMKIPMEDASYAAYLPMAHLYGYLLNLGCFFSDCSLALCSPMTMLDSSPAHENHQKGDFNILKPRFISTVPLVMDRLLKEVHRKLEARTPISVPIFNYLMDYKIRWKSRGFDTPITNKLVCSKIKKEFGGELMIMIVGSAPLNERTQAVVQAALDINLLQGYGATETSVACTGMMTSDLSYGECGVPLHSAKYYLKDWTEGGYSTQDYPNPRGEIVVGGPIVAVGYYKMPEETAETFHVDEEGTRWFETGDIGEVLPNGTLKIIDRKKDLVKFANGEYVSLGKIESGLRSCQLVENICICTDRYSNHVTALVSPNRKSMTELAAHLHKSDLTFEQLCDDPAVMRHVTQEIEDKCHELNFARKEVPVEITIVKEEWTQDNNLLTAAFKMKRKQVNDFYRGEIRAMFERAGEEDKKVRNV